MHHREHSAVSTASDEVSHEEIEEKTKMKKVPDDENDNEDQHASLLSSKEDENAPDETLPSLPLTLPSLPTSMDYAKFALPCLGLWMAGPLLSVVDTAFVGLSVSRSLSARQLAALGPATTFCDGAGYIAGGYLNVATNVLYGANLAAVANGNQSQEKLDNVLRMGVRLALLTGIMFTVTICTYAREMMSIYMGQVATEEPDLLEWATDYIRIRSFCIPTLIVCQVLQAALLASKDSITPLKPLLYSTVIDISGDAIGVTAMQMGLRGAAIATVVAQWIATVLLVIVSKRKLLNGKSFELFGPCSSKPVNEKDRVFLIHFLLFALPVLVIVLGKIAVFGLMTNAAAAVPGQPISLATHQILLVIAMFLQQSLETFSQTARAFLPPFVAPLNDYMKARGLKEPDAQGRRWEAAALYTTNHLFKVGMIATFVVASFSGLVAYYGSFLLTSSIEVQQAVRPLAFTMFLGALFSGPVAVSEGVVLAKKQVAYLAVVYILTTCLLPPVLVNTKKHGTLTGVWWCFVAFQFIRSSLFVARVYVPVLYEFVVRRLRRGNTSLQKRSSGFVHEDNFMDLPEEDEMNVEFV